MVRFRSLFLDGFLILFMVSALISFRFNAYDEVRLVFWFIAGLFILPSVSNRSTIDKIVLIYVLCGLFSIIGLIIHPYPFEFFVQVFMHSYLPIMFYYYGKECQEPTPRFYLFSTYAFALCAIVGFYFLLTNPGWYVDRSLERLNELGFYTEDTLVYAKFGSFLDAYHVSNLGMFALCCCIGLLKSPENNKIKKIISYFLFVIAIVSVFLARQRVSMYISIVFVLYFFLSSTKKNFITPVIILFGVGFFSYYILESINDSTLNEIIFSRFSKEQSSTLVSSRSGTWWNAIMNQRDYIFGHGIGGGGHLAYAEGIQPTVRDGSYFKVLLETGFLSTICLLYLLYYSLKKSFKNKELIIEFLTVLFFSFSMIGANVIEFQYVIIPMWFAIGRVSGYRKEKQTFRTEYRVSNNNKNIH